jgi:hypothetical protein
MKKNQVITIRSVFLIFFSFIVMDKFYLNDVKIYTSKKKLLLQKIKPVEVKEIETDIISALIHVESSGNDSAYNKTEEAVGCLQIRPVMVREVNRILKKTGKEERFDLEDRWDREKSLEMFNIWREYHHPNSTDEVIARNWNGGPNGFNKESTLKYWKKVRGRLEIES